MASIAEMAEKGRTKLARKSASMASSWEAAKGRMKTNYAGLFGPNRTSAYNAGIDAATYRAPDPNKWADRWSAKMAE